VSVEIQEVEDAIRRQAVPLCRRRQAYGLLEDASEAEKVHPAGKRRRLEASVLSCSMIARNID
jgi:hypothetical protein